MAVHVFLIDAVKAIVVRLVLVIHSLLAVWRVVSIVEDDKYWWLAIVDVGIILEGFVSIIARKGEEYKWSVYNTRKHFDKLDLVLNIILHSFKRYFKSTKPYSNYTYFHPVKKKITLSFVYFVFYI